MPSRLKDSREHRRIGRPSGVSLPVSRLSPFRQSIHKRSKSREQPLAHHDERRVARARRSCRCSRRLPSCPLRRCAARRCGRTARYRSSRLNFLIPQRSPAPPCTARPGPSSAGLTPAKALYGGLPSTTRIGSSLLHLPPPRCARAQHVEAESRWALGAAPAGQRVGQVTPPPARRRRAARRAVAAPRPPAVRDHERRGHDLEAQHARHAPPASALADQIAAALRLPACGGSARARRPGKRRCRSTGRAPHTLGRPARRRRSSRCAALRRRARPCNRRSRAACTRRRVPCAAPGRRLPGTARRNTAPPAPSSKLAKNAARPPG